MARLALSRAAEFFDRTGVRPHQALKFGKETRTPAMQAGLAKKQLTLRDVFCFGGRSACALVYLCRVRRP